ncbi:MAG: Hsp20/alpha crystallin family protein [Bacteroidia bacterium]|nr:Hsp20/alpha crystallin family protein [Bacteroidia bacterium]
MTLIKWQKESPARSILNSVDLFNDFFNDFAGNEFRRWNAPAVNISETEQLYKLQLAVPGLKKEDFKLAIEDNTLVISAEQKLESTEKNEKFTRREFSFSSFTRRFNLPENVDQNHIGANYENGVMLVTLPKKAEEKAKTREISIA